MVYLMSPEITDRDARATGSRPAAPRAEAHGARGHGPGSATTRSSSSPCWRRLACLASGAGPATRPPRPSPRGQGVRLPQGSCACLRCCGIRCTIPDKSDRAHIRRKLGSRGGRPPRFDPVDRREPHAVECGRNRLKKEPRCRHAIRPARGQQRGDRPRRGHERVAVTLALTRWDPRSTSPADRCRRRHRRSRLRARCCAPGSRDTDGTPPRG